MKKTILIIGIIFLLVGISLIPTTTSFPLKKSLNITENNVTYQTSQFYPSDIDYNKHFIYEQGQEHNSRFLSKERFSHYPHELFGYAEVGSFYQNILSTDISNNGEYVPHEPIFIYGNNDFTEENGVTGGNGTETNPYIIEGWEINTNSVAINIEYTTAYFLIKNCLLVGVSYAYGIDLNSITVGFISDCIISSNYFGIDISSSTNITLRNNTLYDNEYDMRIYGSEINQYHHDIDTSNTVNGKPVYYLVDEHDIVIDENYDIGCLWLISCVDILVTDVTISDSYCAVLIFDSSNITITTSNFLDSRFGICLGQSPNNAIIGCNLVDARINIWESPNTFIRDTTISGNQGFGVGGYSIDDYYQDIDTSNTLNGKPIYYLVEEQNEVFKEPNVGYLALVNCENMVVEKVKISNNMDGMLIAGTNAVIKNCETSYNDVGLSIFGDCELDVTNFITFYNTVGCLPFYSSNIDFLNCVISGYIGGIQIDYSHDITIKDCLFTESGDDGVTLRNSYNCEISDNTFSIIDTYGTGIFVSDDSWGNTISHNKIHSGVHGIFISGSHNNTICHNIIHDLTMFGIWLHKSVDNNIHRNDIYNIVGEEWSSGIHVYESARCKFNYNNIYDNYCGLSANRCNVNATYNWWGSKNGPSGIGPGDGDSIDEVYEATVEYEPWLERPRSKQLNYGYSGLFMRLMERFPLFHRLLDIWRFNLL